MKTLLSKLLYATIVSAVFTLSVNAQVSNPLKHGKFAEQLYKQPLQTPARTQNNFKRSQTNSALGICWQKCIGGKRDEYAYNVIKLADGNYLTCGGTNSHDGDFNAIHGNYDAFLIKTDKAGNIIWQKTYGGKKAEAFQYVREKSNGNLIAVGWTNSNDGQVSGNHSNDGSNDAWLIETNSTGKLLWRHCYGGSGDDYGVGVIITHQGDIVFSGLSSSNDGDVPYNHGDYDAWLVKLKPSGIVDFSISIGDTGYNDFVDVAEIKGNYLAVGTTSKKTGDSAEPYYDAHAALFDKSGKIIFYRKYGGTSSDDGNALVTTQDGNAVLAGHVSSSDGDAVGNKGFNMWVWKIDLANNGNIIWQNNFGVSKEIAAAYNVIETHDRGIVLVGGVAPVIYDPFQVEDAYAAKVNAAGKALWTKRFGGGNAEFLSGGVEEEDGSILVSGATSSNDGDVSGNHGGAEDMWLVNLGRGEHNNDDVTNNSAIGKIITTDNTLDKIQISNYPNPFSTSTTISFFLTQSQKVSLQIFDETGRLVKILAAEKMQAGTRQLTWNAKDEKGRIVNAGIYFLKMQTGSYTVTRKLVVVK